MGLKVGKRKRGGQKGDRWTLSRKTEVAGVSKRKGHAKKGAS